MKNYGAKIFKNKLKLNKLLSLANSGKYSVPKLQKIFRCGRTTIHGIFSIRGIKVKNLGRFKKRYFCNDKFFEKITPISAYWAGFITADGCLSKNSNGKNKVLSIGLGKLDNQHLKNFKRAIKSDSKISFIQGNNSVRIGIRSDVIFDSLIGLGIVPNKSFKMGKVVIPDKLMSYFIRGVFDGDGSLSGKRAAHLQISIAGHALLLRQIQNVFIKKCMVKNVKLYPASYTDECTIFRLQYTGSQIFRILKFLYRNSTDQTRLKRKYKKYIMLKNRFPLSFKGSIK